MPPPKKIKIMALQRDAAALFKLLGGSADDRLRFWEIFKGITTPVQAQLIDQQIAIVGGLVNQANGALKQLQKTAGAIRD